MYSNFSFTIQLSPVIRWNQCNVINVKPALGQVALTLVLHKNFVLAANLNVHLVLVACPPAGLSRAAEGQQYRAHITHNDGLVHTLAASMTSVPLRREARVTTAVRVGSEGSRYGLTITGSIDRTLTPALTRVHAARCQLDTLCHVVTLPVAVRLCLFS